jgi:PKD repeat protein/pimeloyl-ACP methyl ester carboxylesterase
MKIRIVLILLLTICLPGLLTAQSWPIVICNTQQLTGNAALQIRDGLGLTFNYVCSFQTNKKLVASNAFQGQTVPSNVIIGQSTSWWYLVDLPGVSGPSTGYVAAGSTFSNPECNSEYIQVVYSTVNLRSIANNLSSWVDINGSHAHIYQNQKFAVVGSTIAGGTMWYKIDLPENCMPNYGWVAAVDVATSTQLVNYYTSGSNGLPAPSLSYSTITSTSALLNWNQSIQPTGIVNTSFSIYNNVMGYVGSNNTVPPNSYTDQPLNPGTTYNYYVTASYGSCISNQSNTVTFTTPSGCSAPVISSNPASQTVSPPAPTSFSVNASGGTQPYTYQWEYNNGSSWANVPNNAPYSGITSSVLNISSTSSGMNGYQYRCVVSSGSPCNIYNTTSSVATLSTGSGCSAPVISSNPSGQTVLVSGPATFSVSATGGTTPYSYQWEYYTGSTWTNVPNSAPYSGVTSATLNISNSTIGMNGYQYKCIVTSGSSCASFSTPSSAATLTVGTTCVNVAITSNPVNQSIAAGANATFSVTAAGTTPITFVWQKNDGSGWVNLTNAGNTTWTTTAPTSTLTLSSVTTSMNTYQYRCKVSNGCPSNATSNLGVLTVTSTTGISNVLVQNIIDGNSSFTTPYPLWSGTTTQAPTPIKICADGSKATQVIFTNNSGIPTGKIRFWIKSDEFGSNSPFSGYFRIPDYNHDIANNIVTGRFTHPKYLPASYPMYRPDTIIVVDTSNPGSPLFKIPIRIYRAPVLMVHGLWGWDEAFAPMEDSLNNLYPPVLTKRADYRNTNSKHFTINKGVVPNHINMLLCAARNNYYSAGKADVIGHSMGGVLARIYLQSTDYNQKNDIHKLITINTPHSGSQFANLLDNYLCPEGYIARPLVDASLDGVNEGKSVSDGAIEDLAVGSDAMDELNIDNLNNSIVPCHSIGTYTDCSEGKMCFLAGMLSALSPKCALSPLGANGYISFVFNGEDNDRIVSISSQMSGLPFGTTSLFPNQEHLGAQKNNSVINSVKVLLNTNPDNTNFFAQNGYDPANLVSFYRPAKPNNYVNNFQDGSINFVYPPSGASYNSGDTIPIEITSTNGINRIFFSGFSINDKNLFLDSAFENGIIKYIVPADAYGRLSFITFGYNATSECVDYDTLILNVNQQSTLDSISTTLDTFYVQNKYIDPLTPLTAHFSNGYSYSIDGLEDVVYEIADTTLAERYYLNVMKGKQEGLTSIKVSYKGKEKHIPLVVIPQDTTLEIPQCVYVLSDSAYNVQHSGGTHLVGVSATSPGCSWTVINTHGWVHVSLSAAQGNKQLVISVDSCNDGVSRSGDIIIAGITYRIEQTCTPCNMPVANFTSVNVIGKCPLIAEFVDSSITDEPSTRLWTFYNDRDTITSTLKDPLGITFNNAGNYSVNLEVTNSCGTTNVLKTDLVQVNCDKSEAIIISPNPATNKVHIRCEQIDNGYYTIVLKSVEGREVKRQEVQVTDNILNTDLVIAELSSGIYMMSVTVKSKRHTFKITKL